MDSARLHVKFFAEPGKVELEAFIPVLHRWIREQVLPEMVIDVVDYGHVKDGPGVVLIGHGGDYYLDSAEGRLGLLYSRKRAAPAPAERLSDAFRRALNACRLLEQEKEHSLKFRTDEVLLRVPDRLRADNSDAALAALQPELETFFGKLYAGSELRIERTGGAKDPLSVRIRASQAPGVPALLERLGGPPVA
jgi:hypothetical protein